MDSDEKMSSQDFLLQQGLFYGTKHYNDSLAYNILTWFACTWLL